jgi:hypothetical protein
MNSYLFEGTASQRQYDMMLPPIARIRLPDHNKDQTEKVPHHHAATLPELYGNENNILDDSRRKHQPSSNTNVTSEKKTRENIATGSIQSGSGSYSSISLEFVNFHGPPAKRTAASATQIRAHAMRQVHRERKVLKGSKLASTTTMFVCNQLRPALPKHRCKYKHRDTQDSGNPRQQAYPEEVEAAANANTPLASAPTTNVVATDGTVMCAECGLIQYFELPASRLDFQRALTSGHPREIQGGGALGPLVTAPVPITHRMHELIDHCKYPVQVLLSLTDRIKIFMYNA